jgi:RimJ/RimL family protein N-acetyltransferase
VSNPSTPSRQRSIELQPFLAQDIPQLCAWLPTERALLTWGGPSYAHPITVANVAAAMRRAEQSGDTHRVYRLWEPNLDAVIGHAELVLINRYHRNVRLARLLIGPPELRGQGYGKAMLRALLDVAFTELGVRRVELEVYDFNVAAQKVYESLGFVREGVRRDAVRCEHEWWDSILMARLSDDPDASVY